MDADDGEVYHDAAEGWCCMANLMEDVQNLSTGQGAASCKSCYDLEFGVKGLELRVGFKVGTQ